MIKQDAQRIRGVLWTAKRADPLFIVKHLKDVCATA